MHKGTDLEHPKLLIRCKRVEMPPKAIMDLFRLVSLVSMKKGPLAEMIRTIG